MLLKFERHPERERPKATGLRVLVADDSPLDRKVTQALLGRLGQGSDAVRDGEQATEISEVREYDVVLMDILMPKMDGLEATQRIRRRAKRAPHVVAVTGDPLLATPERCRQAGMDGSLLKPVRLEDLAALIHRVAAERGKPPPA